MASSTAATQRATTATPPPAISPADDNSKNPTRKNTTESPTITTIRNLGKFSPHYALFIWSVLFMTLAWNNRISAAYLLSVTKVSFLHFALLLSLPEFVILHKTAGNKRLVWCVLLYMLFFLFIGTLFELVLMQGEMFMVWAFATTVPLILLHASLSRGDEFVDVVEIGGVNLIVQEKGDIGDNLPENMV